MSGLTSACVDADPDAGAERSAHAAELAAIQGDVDTLLAATQALDDAMAARRAPPAVTAAHAQLEATIEAATLAAQELDPGAALDASAPAVSQLSRRAAQLAPQLRRLKRAILASTLTGDARADLLVRLSRIQIAARAVDVHAVELHGLAEADRLTGLGLDATRSGERRPLVVLSEGHADAVDAAFEDGELGITIHDETVDPDVERDPANVILAVKPSAKLLVPDARFSFLGPVGATVWVLPQDQLDAESLGVLFLGLSSEEIEPGTFVDDTVDIRFRDVRGPNGFSLFESPEDESTPPPVLVDSEDGLPDTVALPSGTHRHANWAFEAAGIYRVKVDVRGRLAGVAGQPLVSSPRATLTFAVLP